MRNSPALRELLLEAFDRFPFSGLSLLVLKNETAEEVERDLDALIAAGDIDDRERARRSLLPLRRSLPRRSLLALFRQSSGRAPIEFTALSMSERRWPA